MPEYDIEKYRTYYPYLKSGMMYFDHAAVSPFSLPVREAIENYLTLKSETEPGPFEMALRTMAKTKVRLGELLHSSPERVAIFDNTSNGLNVLATGLDWKSGDRVLVTDMEFPANVYPFMNLNRLGVEVDFVKNRKGEIRPEDVEASITPKTRLFSISHVQFLHGFKADLAALGSLCRQKGIVFCVDAIQAAGVVPIDVNAMKIDFLSSGAQKWLMAPEGTAFIYVSEECQQKLKLGSMGWMNNKDFFSDFFRYRIDLDPSARRFENGTPNFAGVFGLNASLQLLLEVGVEKIHRHLGDLTKYITDRVSQAGLELVSPASPANRAGIVTFKPKDAAGMFTRLKKENIHVSIRENCIRFSPHFYNTQDELEKALNVALQ